MRIILQIALIIAVVFLGVYFLANHNSKAQAWKKIAAFLFIGFSVFAILFPQIADIVASWLGMERGTDLILYGLILAVIYLVFSRSFARKREQQEMAKIVRKVAILERELEKATKPGKTRS